MAEIDPVPAQYLTHVTAVNDCERVKPEDAGNRTLGLDVRETTGAYGKFVIAMPFRDTVAGAFYLAHGEAKTFAKAPQVGSRLKSGDFTFRNLHRSSRICQSFRTILENQGCLTEELSCGAANNNPNRPRLQRTFLQNQISNAGYPITKLDRHVLAVQTGRC